MNSPKGDIGIDFVKSKIERGGLTVSTPSQAAVLANQKAILKNQAVILKNQNEIKKNQATLTIIVKNQKKILAALRH